MVYDKLEDSTGCKNDYLLIKDGGSEGSEVDSIGTFCGEDSPGQFTSSRNQLYLKFKSDLNDQEKGFEMNFQSKFKLTSERPKRLKSV